MKRFLFVIRLVLFVALPYRVIKDDEELDLISLVEEVKTNFNDLSEMIDLLPHQKMQKLMRTCPCFFTKIILILWMWTRKK